MLKKCKEEEKKKIKKINRNRDGLKASEKNYRGK
jgi:hypothetical protein